jgi:hypothetical protein
MQTACNPIFHKNSCGQCFPQHSLSMAGGGVRRVCSDHPATFVYQQVAWNTPHTILSANRNFLPFHTKRTRTYDNSH